MNDIDPPASAWEYAGSAPFAGLRVHQAGVPLDQARRIVVLFHGYGAPGDDLVSLSRVLEAGEGAAFVFPEAPVALPVGGRAWFRRDRSNFEMGLERARELVESVSEQSPGSELVVGGFSQGAMLAANLIVSADKRVVAGLIFSPADLLPHPPRPSSRRVPLLISHGTRDRILPFGEGRALAERFRTANFDVTFVPFDGPHTISRGVIDEANSFLAKLR